MEKKNLLKTFLSLFLFLFVSCDFKDNKTSIAVSNSVFLIQENAVITPKGWIGFCKKYNYEISYSSKKTMSDLTKVFYPIHDNFNYVADTKDSWDILEPDNMFGDCDDFAMTLRHNLIKSGFLKQNVRIALGFLDGGYHAVCVVELSNGVLYVCDQGGICNYKDSDMDWDMILDETEQYWVKLPN